MKIIVSYSFLAKYKKLVSLIDLEKLTLKIKNIKLITLKYPYLKLKVYIGGIAIRGVLLQTKGGNFVFLILCLKKDKNCGYNLTFNNIKQELENIEVKVIKDLEEGKYYEY